jgi:hypothetical protein
LRRELGGCCGCGCGCCCCHEAAAAIAAAALSGSRQHGGIAARAAGASSGGL